MTNPDLLNSSCRACFATRGNCVIYCKHSVIGDETEFSIYMPMITCQSNINEQELRIQNPELKIKNPAILNPYPILKNMKHQPQNF